MENVETVWRPIPGTSQELALDTRAEITLYTGTRGPGKTDAQLMRFRRRVGMGYGSYWRGVIFDKVLKDLDDIVLKSRRWFTKFEDGAYFLESKGDYRWVWPTGEELLFRAAEKPSDYWSYHGQEFPFIGWNELCKHASPELYNDMLSCNRSTFEWQKDGPRDPKTGERRFVPQIPLEVFATTNPLGPGHNWVKREFIDPAPYGEIVRKKVSVFDPKTQERVVVERTQVAIFGSYRENIYLPLQYIARLEQISDKNKRKAWLEGDWDITAGGAIDDLWDKAVHVISRFRVPHNWRVDRALDWGSSSPCSVGWFAEANGEEVLISNPDGSTRIFCPPADTLIQIAEWYIHDEDAINKGKMLTATKVAEGILEVEKALLEGRWISEIPWSGPADNQIRNVIEASSDSIEVKMQQVGVYWEESDKSKGSRKNGLELIRERLEAAIKGERPALYFMENCRHSIATIPTLPRSDKDPDDVDTTAEDHAYDMTRYRVLKGANRFATGIETSFSR